MRPAGCLTTTTTVKVFIDVFIGIWALVLAAVWAYGIEKENAARRCRSPKSCGDSRGSSSDISRCSCSCSALALVRPDSLNGLKAATAEADLVRGIFFVMTFFSIGMASNFKKLWAEGIGRLALVYVVSLFGFIIWIGLAISWLFFHGVHPPLITGGG